jgi:hypothetical protein
MPWQCRLVDREEQRARGEKPQPGDMWYAPAMLDPAHDGFYLKHYLSVEYQRDWLGKRPPIEVCLPNGDHFIVDTRVSNATDGHGWTVTGEAPNITVSPSINCIGRYHGWLRDGVLSEDVEGRVFPQSQSSGGSS